MSDSSTKPSLPSTPRHNRLIFALDVPGRAEALPLITALATEVGYFKVGLEMMCGPDGVEVVRTVIGAGGRVFLDMKLHDIPATVERAAMNAGRLGANFLTVHALGGATMMRAAVKGAAATNPNLRILAITILTSHAPQDLVTIGLITPAEGERAIKEEPYRQELFRRIATSLAVVAESAGCHGIVCSPEETHSLRTALKPDTIVVNPGVRQSDGANNDQARTGTATGAIQNGATYLVVGRPIRDAEDPAAAARAFNQQIVAALEQ